MAKGRERSAFSAVSSVHYSIVTPSYNMLGYLKRCSASVADQQGVGLEHIVVDGGSTDGTVEWLQRADGIRSITEPDGGMYDAINKGLAMARGDIVAYLNCDEQYLPGALAAVRAHFRQHPEADVVFGDVLAVRPDGSLIAYRKAHQPRWYYIWSSYLYAFTCSMFVRRRVLEDGFRFRTDLQAVADADFVVRLLRRGHTFSHLRRYLAAFTITADNKSKAESSLKELAEFRKSAPSWIRVLALPLNVCRLAERVLAGVYCQRLPVSYALYVGEERERAAFTVPRASFRWSW